MTDVSPDPAPGPYLQDIAPKDVAPKDVAPRDDQEAAARLLGAWTMLPPDYLHTEEGVLAATECLCQAGIIAIHAWEAEFAPTASGKAPTAAERVKRRRQSITTGYAGDSSWGLWLVAELKKKLHSETPKTETPQTEAAETEAAETEAERLARENLEMDSRLRDLTGAGVTAIQELKTLIEGQGDELRRGLAGGDLASLQSRIGALEVTLLAIKSATEAAAKSSLSAAPEAPESNWGTAVNRFGVDTLRTVLAFLVAAWLVSTFGGGPMFGKATQSAAAPPASQLPASHLIAPAPSAGRPGPPPPGH